MEDIDIIGWGKLPENLFKDISFSAKNIVEIGSAYGRSVVCLARFLKQYDARIYAIDIWSSHRQWCSFLENIHSYNVANIVKPVRCPSNMAVNAFLDESIDFIYVDGDHKYNSVKSDILCWLPKLKTGHQIAFHDVHLKPVRKAIDDLIGLDNGYIDGITWIYKKI